MELLLFSVVLLGDAMDGAIDARVEKVVALPFCLHTSLTKAKIKINLNMSHSKTTSSRFFSVLDFAVLRVVLRGRPPGPGGRAPEVTQIWRCDMKASWEM